MTSQQLNIIENEIALRAYLEQARELINKPLGQLLLSEGLITQRALDDAMMLKKSLPNRKLGDILLKLGSIDNETLQHLLHRQLGVPQINLDGFTFTPELIRALPVSVARERQLLPILALDNVFVLAGSAIPSEETYQQLRFILQKNIMLTLSDASQIQSHINQYYGAIDSHIEDEARDAAGQQNEIQESRLWQEAEFLAKQKPIVKLVQTIFEEALAAGASDIHFRPHSKGATLAYRVDGELRIVKELESHLIAPVVSRIKILAKLNIAEHRLPQDGRIAVKQDGRSIDLRVSIIPTPYGENTVIRLLNSVANVRQIDRLGYSVPDLARIQELIHKENGLLLVTGPTGSGKTTTLYAMLQAIGSQGLNVMTVEDPIEFQLNGMVQVQLLSSQGFGFPQTLRHVLRHDPDIIMIGEIRDAETAQIAIEAALTGHLVLSTLHTTSACGAIPRLLELGVSPQLLKSTLLGVIAQRLVHHNCPKCRVPEIIHSDLRKRLKLTDEQTFVHGEGCPSCDQRGYKGRLTVYELFEPDAALRDQFGPDLTDWQLQQLAIEQGMQTMMHHGMALAEKGELSLMDVYRACG